MKRAMRTVLSATALLGAMTAFLGNAQPSPAATTGLFRFDDAGRIPGTETTPGTDIYFDDGPDTLNLSHINNYGTTSLSSDIPPVATAGSSLNFVRASPMDSPLPASGNFGIGATGQITVEFWFKSNLADTIRYFMSQDDYNYGGTGSGWSMHQNPPDGTGKFGIRFWQADNNYAQFKQLDTPVIFSTGQWYHLAFTGNLTSGEMKFYKDGVQIAASNGFSGMTVNPKTDFPLVIGTDSQPGRAFAGEFLMDDLRFSNVALLPGNGTGVDELAWNTSLTVAPPAVPGDFDSDGDVDGADFVAWQTHFPLATGATLADGDADGDGDVDGADFVVWQTHFPFTPGPGVSPVPEPHSLPLMIAGCMLFFAWRRVV